MGVAGGGVRGGSIAQPAMVSAGRARTAARNSVKARREKGVRMVCSRIP
ncbi:MAG: hypothetical protein WCP22_07440 [Chlamydiota bacterium]